MQNKTPKKRKAIAIIFLLLLAPVLGELLSGSSPPNEFFDPLGFVVMTVLYGGGSLLIREARVRWKLGYSIIFLAIAYGILEEGLLMHSFFNHHHIDLDVLRRYGMFLKCQWPWTIQLIIYHATVSTLIPILITDLLFPDLKNESLLNRGGIITFIVLLVLDTIAMSALIINTYSTVPDPYVPDALNLFIWTLITFALIYLAYKLKDARYTETKIKLKSPFRFFINGFFFIPLVVISPYILANVNAPAIVTIALLLCYAYLTLRFVFRQMYNENITTKHKVFVIDGVTFSFVLLAFFNQYVNRVAGMAATGAVCFILMVIFSIIVLRKDKKFI